MPTQRPVIIDSNDRGFSSRKSSFSDLTLGVLVLLTEVPILAHISKSKYVWILLGNKDYVMFLEMIRYNIRRRIFPLRTPIHSGSV